MSNEQRGARKLELNPITEYTTVELHKFISNATFVVDGLANDTNLVSQALVRYLTSKISAANVELLNRSDETQTDTDNI